MKIACLGGGGCFGINFAKTAIEHGHEVIGCGRSPLRGDVFSLGVDRMGYRYRPFVVGADNEFIFEWLNEERPQVIVCYAAQGEGAASYKARHWKYFYRTNILGLAELTEMLLGVDWLERVVSVGTSEVYGSVHSASKEDAAPRPSSVYATSKLAFDYHLQAIAKHWKFPAVVVRPSNCVTPGQQLHRVVPKTFLLAMTGRKLALHGGGAALKSYLDAEDLSRAILLLSTKGEIGEIYNVGPDRPISIRKLVEYCAWCMDVTLEDVSSDVADRTGQDACYWIDSSKLKALGWAPVIPLTEAVQRVHDWVRWNIETLAPLPTDYEMRA